MKITDTTGRTAADGHVTATSGTGTRGTSDVTIPYKATRSGAGTLTAYEELEEQGKGSENPEGDEREADERYGPDGEALLLSVIERIRWVRRLVRWVHARALRRAITGGGRHGRFPGPSDGVRQSMGGTKGSVLAAT
ncbi:Gmad2 immunoglobulin-like domain-containing protein [Streptomyces ipomoeae]|uniref:Gmad2 immunoglobulin-like domain-containing protein n=1 Tax=Streptomyces ipomoeae TaxID=103232 RepID=UPI002852EC31|nr:Gmad2 immunoglobulin-like domain-containing protein [Streptomyces ipomoeae]